MCPKLDTLILTNNRLTKFSDIDGIASCKTLTRLTLAGNMVANLQNYRLYAIYKIPTLKSLDYQNITQKERENAAQLFTEKVQQEVVQSVDPAKMDKSEAETAEVKEIPKGMPTEQMEESKEEKVQ